MPTRMEEPIPQSVWKRRMIFLAVALLPLLFAAGILAPQVVRVVVPKPEPRGVEVESGIPALDFSEPLPGQPLLLPLGDDGTELLHELDELLNSVPEPDR